MVHIQEKVEWQRRAEVMGEDGYYTVTLEGLVKAYDLHDSCNIMIGVSMDVRDISKKHAESVVAELSEQPMLIITGW